MCGLAGVILEPRKRLAEAYDEIWRAFTGLLVGAQSRGRDAAGAAVVRVDGAMAVHKAGVPAAELVEQGGYRGLREWLGDDTSVLLGHARLKTNGAVGNPANNHPIVLAAAADVHPAIIGIHNGRIRNERVLFLKYGYERVGEVDSEVLFRLAAEACRFDKSRAHMLQAYLGEVYGQAAAIWVVPREPQVVYVLRKRQPLCHRREPELGVVYVASLRRCMDRVVGASPEAEPYEDECVHVYDTRQSLVPQEVRIATPEQRMEELDFDDLRRVAEAKGFCCAARDADAEEQEDVFGGNGCDEARWT